MPPLETQAALFALRVKLDEIQLNFEVRGLPTQVSRPDDLVGDRGLGAAPIFSRAETRGNAALQQVLEFAQRFLGKRSCGYVELLEARHQGLLQPEDVKRPVSGFGLAAGGAAVGPLAVSAQSHPMASERFTGNVRVKTRPILQGRPPDGLLELSQEILSLGVRRGRSLLLRGDGGRTLGGVFGYFGGRRGERGGFWREGGFEIGQGGLEKGGASDADDKENKKEDEADSQKPRNKPFAKGR